MTARPHVLHLEMDGKGWLTWSLDCPYSADEIDNPPGRPCNLLTENMEPYPVEPKGPDWQLRYPHDLASPPVVELMSGDPIDPAYAEAILAYEQAIDDRESWIPTPGCFVKQYLEESGEWDEVFQFGIKDPTFPLEVDVVIDGQDDSAYVAGLVPWTCDR